MSSTRSSTPPAASTTQPASNHNAWLAIRLELNVTILTYYAISLTALILVFIVGHWARSLSRGGGSRSAISYPITALSRATRKVSLLTLPGFTSVGHAITVTVYVALNALFSFYRVDYSKSANLAARFGWMATGNFAFVVFLALKNTPLAILTAYSYERLNNLHQIAGYTTLLHTILHGAIYTDYFMKAGRINVLQEHIVTAGIVSGFGMFFVVFVGAAVRRLKYELFYVAHVALFIVIIVTLGLHRPSFDADKTLIVTVLVASAWGADRLIRIARLAYNGINNEATIYPLPNGGTRIVLKKPITRARPGKHCYVWLPQIRALETHPFTIVATEPNMELIINTYSGFTQDLHQRATQKPGTSLKVSVEGPYGTLPDPMDYDKVVLVAGGSGATFTIGLASDLIQKLAPDSTKQIEFIWVTRSNANVAWFAQHLARLARHEHSRKIALKLHLTQVEAAPAGMHRAASQDSTDVASLPVSPSLRGKSLEVPSPVLSTQTSSVALSDREKLGAIERARHVEDGDGLSLPVIHGRPDIEVLVREAILSTPSDQRVLVATCGPTGLVDTVRNTTARCISVNGPAVELHCEQFGW